MNTILWTSLVLVVTAVIALVRATRRAPLGYEDLDGFHVGREVRPVMATAEAGGRHRTERVAAVCH